MKIVAVADLHNHLPEIPQCDILLIGGDVSFFREDEDFIHNDFAAWLMEVPATYIVGVAGNHDWYFYHHPQRAKKLLHWNYLLDSGVELEGLKIWGSPWQPPFFDWAFNLPEPELAKKWALIPDDTDIFLLHGPPFGLGDRTKSGEHVGSWSLRAAIERIKPKLVVCGHIHLDHGIWGGDRKQGWLSVPENEFNGQLDNKSTIIVNASVVNEKYKMVHAPIELEI